MNHLWYYCFVFAIVRPLLVLWYLVEVERGRLANGQRILNHASLWHERPVNSELLSYFTVQARLDWWLSAVGGSHVTFYVFMHAALSKWTGRLVPTLSIPYPCSVSTDYMTTSLCHSAYPILDVIPTR